jgi:hypothetical protein
MFITYPNFCMSFLLLLWIIITLKNHLSNLLPNQWFVPLPFQVHGGLLWLKDHKSFTMATHYTWNASGVDCLMKNILLGPCNLTLANIYLNLLWTSLLDKHLIIVYSMHLSYLRIEVYTYALQLTLMTKVVFESLPILHIRYYISEFHEQSKVIRIWDCANMLKNIISFVTWMNISED